MMQILSHVCKFCVTDAGFVLTSAFLFWLADSSQHLGGNSSIT